MSSITLDMNELVSESQAKFITGEMPMSEWDTYVGQLEQMGLDRYLGVQQAAYDRYRGLRHRRPGVVVRATVAMPRTEPSDHYSHHMRSCSS